MRHIIVEGPDGSGKGNLIRDLSMHLGLPLHPRFVQSTGGPPANLAQLVEDDVRTPAFTDGLRPVIYDRHPVISEPIYGPIIRGQMTGRMELPSWLDRMRRRVADHCVVVFCLPPYTEVFRNVTKPADGIEHMAGVDERIYDIYQAYLNTYNQWPGPYLVHDYTRNPPGSANRGVLLGEVHRLAGMK